MTSRKRSPTISKNGLLKVLNSFTTYYEPPRKQELLKASNDATKAVHNFLKLNHEYRKLVKAEKKAEATLKTYVEQAKKKYRQERIACINAVYLRGAVPSTVKMIERLIAEYSEAIR